jgi:hypothetical protein
MLTLKRLLEIGDGRAGVPDGSFLRSFNLFTSKNYAKEVSRAFSHAKSRPTLVLTPAGDSYLRAKLFPELGKREVTTERLE